MPLSGRRVGQIYEQDRVFNVVVRAAPALRSNSQSIGELLVDLPVKAQVPLGAVADINVVDAGNRPGHEFEYPMVIVIGGGFASSVFLTLFLPPVLCASARVSPNHAV